MMYNGMLPMYNTYLFREIFESDADFLEQYKDSPLPKLLTDGEITTLYWLLFAKYANNPIANYDVDQFKIKMYSIIFQFGPTWAKKLEIQQRLREMTEEEIMKAGEIISNHALNPDTLPSMDVDRPLEYVNEQQRSHTKRSKIDAYANLWAILKNDVSSTFLNKFKPLFKIFAMPDISDIYVSENE